MKRELLIRDARLALSRRVDLRLLHPSVRDHVIIAAGLIACKGDRRLGGAYAFYLDRFNNGFVNRYAVCDRGMIRR